MTAGLATVASAVLVPLVFGQGGQDAFTGGISGAFIAIVLTAAVQYWRGRSQQKVEKAQAGHLKAQTERIIDERWASLMDRVERENEALRARVEELEGHVRGCESQIAALEAQLGLT